MSILIKNVTLNQKKTDILIKDGKFDKIGKLNGVHADEILNGEDKAVLPAFYNMHTHASMSLLRGYSDDKNLFDWLRQDIWPIEEKLTADDIYVASKLAAAEMIHSGTAGFCDMYFEQASTMRSVDETGLRALISFVEMDMFNNEMVTQKIKGTQEFLNLSNPCPERIEKIIAVHSVYMASDTMLNFAYETATKNNMKLNIHACETKKEVDDCYEQNGCSPIEKLYKHKLLGKNTILAHSVWLNEKDIELIKETETTVCTNPASNMKLCSGIFDFEALSKAGCKITLGTDGASSNNNLNMIDEMKLLAFGSKIRSMIPTTATAAEVFKIASLNGARFFGIDAGEIAEGKIADCQLVDLNNVFLTPAYNLISNMVYSADSSCVDTVICDGKILMQNGVIPWEKETIAQARQVCADLIKR